MMPKCSMCGEKTEKGGWMPAEEGFDFVCVKCIKWGKK